MNIICSDPLILIAMKQNTIPIYPSWINRSGDVREDSTGNEWGSSFTGHHPHQHQHWSGSISRWVVTGSPFYVLFHSHPVYVVYPSTATQSESLVS